MKKDNESKRGALVREALVFQLKLMADGLRDVVLMPISLAATALGLIRSADNPEQEFQRVMQLGRQSEQWINLFGQHEPLSEGGRAGSIDLLLTRAEELVREQHRKGDVSDSATTAIESALEAAHRAVRGGIAKDPEKPL